MQTVNQQQQAEPAIDGAFLTILQQHRRGQALSDLSAGLRTVNEAVQLTGRPGSVTIKVTIRPASKGLTGAVVVEDDITVKTPKADKAGSIFFADDAGNLLREDPKQMKLGLRVIEAPTASEQGADSLRKVAGAV